MRLELISDYLFLKDMILHYRYLLTNAPSGNNGGNLVTTIEFNAKASALENVLLDIEGIVAYIYYGAFQLVMPALSGPVSQSQANNIIAIYNALGATPPTLNIV